MEHRHREIPASRQADFLRAGYQAREVFAHRVERLPKCGPDGAKLAARMCEVRNLDQLWQLVIFGLPEVTAEFPDAMFFDSELLWHQQHFGRTGQVASANLAADGSVLYAMVLQSDLVQRTSRRRAFRNRVEHVFRGWDHMLLNGIVSFAADRGFRELRIPRSRFAMQHTDRKRQVKPELFERVYDRAVVRYFRAQPLESWWSLRLWRNRRRVIPAEPGIESLTPGRTVCLCHDTERGFGHRETDPDFAARADREAPAALTAMVGIEAAAGVKATYNVVGCLLGEVRAEIESKGHALAFHSFDHDLSQDQLGRCRGVDYRLKGYRAPRSRITAELSAERLCWYNFEWFASSKPSLGFDRPRLADRLVTIPIALDDYGLHKGKFGFEAWANQILDLIRREDFVAIGLHDCYASHWLTGYPTLLEEIGRLATLRTMDEVAAEMYLAGGT
jgi:hypothetical protein